MKRFLALLFAFGFIGMFSQTASAQSQFDVTATVSLTCGFDSGSPGDAAFGTYDGTLMSATSTIHVTCNGVGSADVGVNLTSAHVSSGGGSWYMTSGTGPVYQLPYTFASSTNYSGSYATGFDYVPLVTSTGTAAPDFSTDFNIAANLTPHIGSYTDTVTATLSVN